MKTRSPMPLPAPEDLIGLLRQRKRDTGLSLATMARSAGLHPNSFNRLFDDSWRPRLDTLLKIRDWLEEGNKRAKPDQIDDLPLMGVGWRVHHDGQGWWIETHDPLPAAARGPYSQLRNAVSAAREMEPTPAE